MRDLSKKRAFFIFLGIHVQSSAHVFYESFLIVCIINGKIIVISDAVCMSSENSHTGGMKSRHPDTSPVQTYDLIHTLSHFLSSLICKGNSKDIPGVYSFFRDQIGDSVSQHSCLS